MKFENNYNQSLRQEGRVKATTKEIWRVELSPSSKKYIVDITREELTEEHVEITKNIYETIWKNSEPTYFGA